MKEKSFKDSKYLRYNFSEEEVKVMSRDLALTSADLAEKKEEKKAVMASFAEDIAGKEAKVGRLARLINNGYEFRTIECLTEFDVPEKGKKRTVRLDTGEEVEIAKMEDSELQLELPAE